jgi:hypothetical protein
MKKPALPEPGNQGFDDAVRQWLQIVCARRGPGIVAPVDPNLTFSASPTKAECDALYAYTRKVGAALTALLKRLDT